MLLRDVGLARCVRCSYVLLHGFVLLLSAQQWNLYLIVLPATHPRAKRGGVPSPLQLVLMSATVDADVFLNYMQRAGGAAAGGAAGTAAGSHGGYKAGQQQEQGQQQQGQQGQAQQGGSSVGMVTIPGFTYPVREYYLEDIFEMTGHVIGRKSR